MSGIIDKNVVQMVFDNVLFQKNAQETLSTLDKLKEALNFEGAVKGIENLGNNVKNAGMDKLYEGVGKVQEGFNALDIVATRVLQNITDRVQGVITQLASSVITQPLKDGFAEYELQMDSVQTITASTGESIGTVNGYLDKLNEYADKTIYSFSDMTANIGKFTNAGVDLDRAVAAIQGISNVAAVSGANTNEASRAMYNFAQALSAGSVKLIDWKSIENANMATVEFKEQLIQTALALGTVVQEGDKYVSTTTDAKGKTSEAFTATSMFNDSLSAQWMTTDVLVQTLEQYSTDVRELGEEEKKEYRAKLMSIYGDEQKVDSIIELAKKAANSAKDVKTFSQLIDTLKESLGSGWTKTWQMIFGDLNEAKVLWTAVNDVLSGFIDKVSDSRNAILETWHKSGYTYNKYGELVKAVYNEQGKLDGDLSVELVENGKMIREEMGGRDLLLGGLQNTYQIFAGIMQEFGKSFSKNFLGIDNDTISDITITGEKLIELSGVFYDYTENVKKSWVALDDKGNIVAGERLKNLSESFNTLATAVRNGYDGISAGFSGLGNILGSFFSSDFFSANTFESAVKGFSSITDGIKSFGEAIKKHFGDDEKGVNKNGLVSFFNGIKDVLEANIWTKLSFFESAFDGIGKVVEHIIEPFGTFSQLLGTVGEKLSQFADAFTKLTWNDDVSKFEPFFSGLADSFNNFIDTLKNSIDFSGFSEFFNTLLEGMTSERIDLFKTFENVIGGLVDILQAFLSIAAPVAAAFANIFGDAVFEALQFIRDLSDRFKDFTSHLIANSETISGIQTLFEGIFSVFKAIAEVLGTVLLSAWDSFGKILSNLLPDGKTLGDTLSNIGEKLKEFAGHISSLVDNSNGMPKLSDIIGKVTDRIVDLFNSFKDLHLLESFAHLLGKIGDGIKHALGGTEDMSLLDTIIEKIKGFLTKIKELLSDENGHLDLARVMETGGIGVVIKKLVELFKELKDNSNDFRGISGFIKDIKDSLTDLGESFQDKFKAESIKAIATSILEIAGALFIIAMIDSASLFTSITAVTGMFALIEQLLTSVHQFSKSDAAILASIAAVLQTLGNSVIMMAGAIAIIGSMDLPNAIQGLGALLIMLEGMVVVVDQLSQVENDLPKISAGLMGLAIAIDLLVVPVKVLGEMDLGALAQGLIAVTIMLGEVVIAAIALSEGANKFSLGDAAAMVLLAESIKIVASAVEKVKDLNFGQIAQGLLVMAAGLVAMVGAAAVVGQAKLGDDLLVLGASLIMLGTSMMMLTESAKGIANVSWEDLGKLAAILAGALVALGVAAAVINGPNLALIGSGILMIAEAIALLVATLTAAEILVPIATGIGAGLSGIAHSLESFANNAAASAFLQFIQDVILFLPQLAVGLAQALIEMVAVLGEGAATIVEAVVNIASSVISGLNEILPQVFELIKTTISGAVDVIVSETPGIFQALGTFCSEALNFLEEQIPNLFDLLKTIFQELTSFLTEEGPLVLETITTLMDTVLNAIIQEAPKIGEAVVSILNTVLDTINEIVPNITQTLLNLLTSLLTQLADYVPQMAEAAMQILQGFLDAIANNIGSITESAITIALEFMKGLTDKLPEIVDTAFKMIIKFIDGLASAIEENHQALFDAIGHLITAIVEAIVDGIVTIANAVGTWFTGENGNDGILDAIGGFVQDIFDAGANLVQGFIDGLLSMPGKLWDSACSLANDAWNAIQDTLDINSPSRKTYSSGKYFVEGFINGIKDTFGNSQGVVEETGSDSSSILADSFSGIVSVGGQLANDFVNAFDPTATEQNIYDNGTNFVQGFIDGSESMSETVASSATAIADSAWQAIATALGIHSPSDVTYSQGENFGQGFANGMDDYSDTVGSSAYSMGDNASSQLSSGIAYRPYEAGEDMANAFASGLTESPMADSLIQKATDFGYAVSKAFAHYALHEHYGDNDYASGYMPYSYRDFYSYQMGMDFIDGFESAFWNFEGDTCEVVSNYGNAIVSSFQNSLDIHSPSKITRSFGVFFNQGFIDGLESNQNDIISTLGQMAYVALDTLESSFDGSAASMSIAPIVDASSIKNAANLLKSSLSTTSSTYNIDADIEYNKNFKESLLTSMKAHEDVITHGIHMIRDDLNHIMSDTRMYMDMMRHMNVVMDSGALVGAISDGVDRALGSRSFVSGRGVI